MPGTSFKQTAREMNAQLNRTTEQPYAFVKQQMREKKHKTSFLSQAIESLGSDAHMVSPSQHEIINHQIFHS
jgi:hypothetical protein